MEIEIYTIKKTEGTFAVTYKVSEDVLKQVEISPVEFAFGCYLSVVAVESAIGEGFSTSSRHSDNVLPSKDLLDIIKKCQGILTQGVEIKEYQVLENGSREVTEER